MFLVHTCAYVATYGLRSLSTSAGYYRRPSPSPRIVSPILRLFCSKRDSLFSFMYSFICPFIPSGVLACLDGYMNIAMEQTEEYVNGQLKAKYGDCFIRGNNGETPAKNTGHSTALDRPLSSPAPSALVLQCWSTGRTH